MPGSLPSLVLADRRKLQGHAAFSGQGHSPDIFVAPAPLALKLHFPQAANCLPSTESYSAKEDPGQDRLRSNIPPGV